MAYIELKNVTYTYPEVVEQIKMILRLGIGAG